MRSSSSSLASLFITVFVGFFFVAMILLESDAVNAQARSGQIGAVELPPASTVKEPAAPTVGSATDCKERPPASNSSPIDDEQRRKLWPKPSLADLKATLDDNDAIATLEAVQVALTEVGDGATYVWHRRHGRLSGAIQPTSSFKDGSGLVCRHLVMALSSGSYSRKAEGIACRQRSGVWLLEG